MSRSRSRWPRRGRYDLIFEVGRRLWRVQCKWGTLSEDESVVTARLGGSYRGVRGHVRSIYSEDEIDLFAIWCEPLRVPRADRSGRRPARASPCA